MPSTGFYLFLQFGGSTPAEIDELVSMPSTGFYLFLLISSWADSEIDYVSMPSTGFYLFLPYLKHRRKTQWEVSMPSTGFYLFLPNNRSECQSSKTKCQCPQRASTYFFWTMPSSHIYSEICVNALNGLLLISSTCTKLMSWHSKTVSMPSTGFYLFLLHRT